MSKTLMIAHNEAPLVSVVVPVYNAGQYLERCVESLLCQSYRALEIILVNDGSTDDSAQICDRYASKEERVKAIHQPNGGVSSARNAGIDIASGTYIGFIDSDDWAEPIMFEVLMEPFLSGKTVDVSICGWYRHESGRVFQPCSLLEGSIAAQTALCSMLSGRSFNGYLWNKLFDASLFHTSENNKRDCGYRMRSDVFYCEDLLLCTEIFLNIGNVYYCARPLYHYIIRSNNTIRTYDKKRETEFTVKKEIIRMTEHDADLHAAAELAYLDALLNYILATKGSSMAKEKKKEASNYIMSVLNGKSVSVTGKLKRIIKYLFPGCVLVMRKWRALAKKDDMGLERYSAQN